MHACISDAFTILSADVIRRAVKWVWERSYVLTIDILKTEYITRPMIIGTAPITDTAILPFSIIATFQLNPLQIFISSLAHTKDQLGAALTLESGLDTLLDVTIAPQAVALTKSGNGEEKNKQEHVL
uniref:Uncharacterized protein n=1 Tax=Cacopsylla melanoneura TaxID=428564 RepID=A0A8D8PSV6_9HEMI